MNLDSQIVPVTAFDNQKPGTSGLRKHVAEFKQPHYTEIFIQSILQSLGDSLNGCCLVIGGDGRYFMVDAIHKIIQICAANKVGKLIIGQDGILSTPAVSCLIRKYSCEGGIILTASHNPGGEDGSFGIKFNNCSGAPASQKVGDNIFAITKEMKEYRTCPRLHVDLNTIASEQFEINGGRFCVEIIDSANDYVDLLKTLFDFNLLKHYLTVGNHKILINCLNGVMGPYAKRVFCQELGASLDSVVNGIPLPDFGGRHPDPNLTYARDLLEAMREGEHQLGAAFDGDGDRCMIIGRDGFFITPCDLLALVAANIHKIPAFHNVSRIGVARSMPTSSALDSVARKLGMDCYETPTGWKFFGNLLDEGLIALCGEESFGIGSDHIREKDGMWGVLAVLSIMACTDKSLCQLCDDHWNEFGRVYFTRYDYEDIDSSLAANVMDTLQRFIIDPHTFSYGGTVLTHSDNFTYTDPVDNSVTCGQGVRIIFDDSSRVVFRLSGTGTSGATIRLYAERHAQPGGEAQEMLAELLEFALNVSRLREITGRLVPSVIT